jgi:hypothetical protein
MSAFTHPGITSLVEFAWITGYTLTLFGILSLEPRTRRVTFGTVHMVVHRIHPRVRPAILPLLFLPGMKVIILAGTLAAIATVPPVRRAWLANVYHLHF